MKVQYQDYRRIESVTVCKGVSGVVVPLLAFYKDTWIGDSHFPQKGEIHFLNCNDHTGTHPSIKMSDNTLQIKWKE